MDSKTWLADTERMLDSLTDIGIAGVAGSSEYGIATIIMHGDPPRSPADVSIHEPTKVQTLDECLAIVPRSVFETLKFDGKVCDNWHLYVVDFCLRCKMLGFEVYTLPMYVYHRSSGSSGKTLFEIIASMSLYPNEYYLTLEKLLYKYKNYYKYIYTTCGVWNTSYPLIFQRYLRFIRSGPKYASERITQWLYEAIT
jgi:GT2 family glycosyltransferase